MNSRNIVNTLLILTITFAIISPGSASAQTDSTTSPATNRNQNTDNRNIDRTPERGVRQEEREQQRTQSQDRARDQICLRLENFQTQVSARFQSRSGQLSDRVNDRHSNITSRRDSRNDRLENRRENRSSNLEEHFAKLHERAQTDEQIAAAGEFERAVKQAIETRRTKVDEAIFEFRKGMDVLLLRRRQQADAAAEAYSDAMKAAIAEMVAECRTTDNPQEVRKSLAEKLKQAREKFNTDRQALEKIGQEARQLAEIRNTAIKNAVDEFRMKVETAVEELRVVFTSGQEAEGNDVNKDENANSE